MVITAQGVISGSLQGVFVWFYLYRPLAIDGYQPTILAIDLCDPECHAFLSLIAITFHF